MKNQTTKILLIVLFLTTCYADNVCAHFQGSMSGNPTTKHLPPPVFPKQGPPPVMEYKFSPNDVIGLFKDHGLKARDIGPLTEKDYSSLPAKAKEGRKFTFPSNGGQAEGCVLSFERRDDMEKIAEYYRRLNSNGKLHSWTFIRYNVLVVLKGEIPEKTMQLYKDAFK